MHYVVINGKMQRVPEGNVTREYLEKQSIKQLLSFIKLKSRTIKGCKNKLVDMLEGVDFTK